MKIYSGRGLGDMYYEIIRDLTEQGRQITVRGHECIEMPHPICLEYESPGCCWMRIPGRKFNPFFALAEVIWILTGNGNVEWISYFNSAMRNFADEGNVNFHGAYGIRLRKWSVHFANYLQVDQIHEVVKKLKEDPYSRRAVMSLWDPERDNIVKSNDYPCNNMVYHTLREGKLEQTVIIRSNDMVWGQPYNAVQFTYLHALVAGELGVKMGTFRYFIQNAHFYVNQYKPTLSNIIQRAYGEKLEAECAPDFDVFTEEQLSFTASTLMQILWKCRDTAQSPVAVDYPVQDNLHLGQDLPEMMWIYTVLKSGVFLRDAEYDFVAQHINALREPFRSLALGFYTDSENPKVKTVLDRIPRKEIIDAIIR